MSNAFSAFGTQLQMGDGADPEVFTTIAEVMSISGPSRTRNTIDVTNHQSPNDSMEFIGGLLDNGEISFEANYLPDNPTHSPTTGLESAFASGDVKNFKLLLTNSAASEMAFAGVVTGMENEFATDTQAKVSVTIKISGPVTITV